MVKPLPQFTQGVQIQPQALPDRQAAITSLSDRLGQFGAAISKVVAAKSKENLTAEKMAGQIQIRDSTSRIREHVLDPQNFSNTATDSYDARMSGMMKGVLNNSDPRIRTYLENFGSNYGDKNRNVVLDRVEKLKKNQLVGSLQEYNKKTTDDAINAKLSGQVIPDPEDKTKAVSAGDFFMSRVDKANDSAMNRGLITPKEAFTYKQAALESYASASYLDQIRKAVVKGKQDKWLDSFNKNKSVDAATKHTVKAQALGLMNQIQQSTKTNLNLIKQQADDTIRQVSNGTLDINDPHVSNVKLRMGAVGGEDQQNFEHRLTAASVFSATKQAMKFIPFDQSKALLKKLEPDASDPGFKFKNKISSSLESQIDTDQANFKKDPFAYVSDNPDVMNAFEARNVAANDGMTKIQPVQAQSISPTDVALDKERMMGANNQQLSVMGNDTAANIVASLDALPDAKSKIQFVNDIYDSYGKDKLIAGRDLKKAGAPQNILDLANLDKIPQAKALLSGIIESLDQKEAIKDRLKDSSTTYAKYQQNASAAPELTTLFGTLPNTNTSEQQKSNMIDLVATAAAGDVLQGNSSDMDNAVKKMANTIYQSRYSAILGKARIPINVPTANAKDAMFAKEKDLPNVPFLGLKREAGSKLTPGEKLQQDQDSIQAGHWRTMGDDSGLYWVDSQGFTPQYMKAGTKTRYEIHWKDLQDKTSELHGLMAKHKGQRKKQRVGLFDLGLSR